MPISSAIMVDLGAMRPPDDPVGAVPFGDVVAGLATSGARKRRCLVLGAGLLGSHVARLLADAEHRVAVLTRGVNPWFTEERQDGIALHLGDLETDHGLLAELIDDAECIIHLASSSRPPRAAQAPAHDVKRSILPALAVMELVASYGVEKMLITSSSGGTVYGAPSLLPTPETHPCRPTTPYAISHVALEHYLQHFERHCGLRYATCRFGNVYGPGELGRGGQGVIGTWLRAISNAQCPVAIGDLDVARDFVYVDDAAQAVRLISEQQRTGTYNVGSGVSTSLREVIEIIQSVTGVVVELARADAPTGHPAADIRVTCLDTTKLYRHTRWAPRHSLESGVSLTWDWIRRELLPEGAETPTAVARPIESGVV